MSLTGADILLRSLRAQGVRAVFGMPGTQNIALYDAFHRSGEGIAHYLVRHEQGATMMANGFARASGEVAAAFTVPGPGAANGATGILDALTDCVPVLLVVGGYERPTARRDRTKMFHGLDQESFFRPICRYFGRPETVGDIPRFVEEAFQAMFAGRHGPAVIEMPPDLAAEPVAGEFPVAPFVPRLAEQPVDRHDILPAATHIRQMRRPVLIVGADCVAANAGSEVQRLAVRLNAPVLYGRRGKGVISDEHPLTAGFTRSKRAKALLARADGVIAVGCRFTQIDTLNWTLRLPPNVVQFDRDRNELGREYPISTGVAANLAPALKALCVELDWMLPDVDPGWPELARTTHFEWRQAPPIPVLGQIRQALPSDGILSVDITATGYNCFDRFPVHGPHSLIYPCHSVSLGFAFPAAIGAKFAAPERPVVSLSGDGGFLMGCFELATAVEHKLGVVAVVVKDNCLSAIKGSQEQAFAGRTIDVHMQVPDFVALARSFGAHAETTSNIDELPRLIHEGLARSGPTVIEVRMEGRVDELIGIVPGSTVNNMSHSVKSIETTWVDLPLRPIPARNMQREIPHWTLFEICKVTLDSGVVGFGETMVYYTWGANTVSDAARNRIVGRHPAENMWDDSLGASLQIALFDAAAKVLDAPLHQLLGKSHRDRCHISWWDIDMPAQDWISECQLAIAHGYNSFKTKGRPWFDVVENTRLLCEAVPPHFEIDMDFNGFGVDTAHCTRLLKELEQFPQVVMYESPIPHSDVAGYRFLRQHTHVPISMHTATHYGDTPIEVAIREEMVDGFVLCGGATRVTREAHVCQVNNRSFFLQIVGTKIAAAFGLHLGAVLENARWPAVNCHQLYERDCIKTPIEVSNGLARVPEGPGLGIELDLEAIELFRTAPKEKPFPYPDLLIAIRWPTGSTTFYNHAAQYWADWLGGRLPFFPRGVYLDHIRNDGSTTWRYLYEQAQKGAVHSNQPPF